MVAPQTDPASVEESASSLTAYATIANEWLNGRVSPQTMFLAMVVVWIALWMLVALRLLGFQYPWKSATTVSAILFIFLAMPAILSWHTSSRPLAVVVQAPLAPSRGAGASTAKVSLGQIVEPIQKRGDSIRVRTKSGETVWLANDSLEII
jgi:hypothetical protein